VLVAHRGRAGVEPRGAEPPRFTPPEPPPFGGNLLLQNMAAARRNADEARRRSALIANQILTVLSIET
jgi:hypothetical protein